MITAISIVLALFSGYGVAVALSMAATFGITAASPGFVTKDYRIRKRYKFLQDLVWLLCASAAGYVTATVARTAHPLIAGVLLAGVMIAVLWTNTWEMRQRGVVHQIMMSLVSAAGVAAGCLLRLR